MVLTVKVSGLTFAICGMLASVGLNKSLMAKKAKRSKNKRGLVALVSTVTGHRYVIRKNNINTPDKLERTKYDPNLRRRVLYKEMNKNLGRNEVKPRKK